MKKIIIASFTIFFALYSVLSANAVTIFKSDGYSYSVISASTAALHNWDNRSPELIVPDSIDNYYIVEIADSAFTDNVSITLVDLTKASMLKSIGFFAFQNCTNISGTITIPSKVNQIGYSAFQGCSSIEEVRILTRQLTVIPDQCFYNCTSLRSVTLPENLTTINKLSFGGCSLLRKVIIPDSITSIDPSAFDGCDNLTILCASDSYAAQYASDNGIDYMETDNLIMGDVDNDGKVNIRDVTYIQLYGIDKYSLDKHSFIRSDINSDNKVNIRDATYIQMYLVQLIPSLYNV